MYFNILPAIKYDSKPIGYPFSESDYVVAKNFFRRYKISDTGFNYSVYYEKFAVPDGARLEYIAEKLYGNPFYDWVIALTNNMISPLFDLPMSENELRIHVEKFYDNPYYDTHHYEIISDEKQMDLFGKVILPGGTWVDETFYNNSENYTASTFPNLTPDSETIPFNASYVFTSQNALQQLDNGFIGSSGTDAIGVSLEPWGTGEGPQGGFVLYPPLKNGRRSEGYLRIGGGTTPATTTRSVTFNPIDSTHYDSITLYAKFGTDVNGGEWPDVISGEYLELQYYQEGLGYVSAGTIIDIGVAQGIEYYEDPQPPSEYGGTGRPEGVYQNLTVYDSSSNPTSMRVTVTVNAAHEVSNIEIIDRGNHLGDGQSYRVLNNDLGAGYILDPGGAQIPLLDYEFYVYTKSENALPNGAQYGRYDTVPYNFTLQLPEAAKAPNTTFRLVQPSNTGQQNDQYGISAIYFNGQLTQELPLGFEWTKIDDDHYVIDGTEWVRISNVWYIKTERGYQYWDGTGVAEVSGSTLARPVTEFEYEQTENEKKREIYILKPQFLDTFVEEFKKASLYKKSSDFVSNRLKKTGV